MPPHPLSDRDWDIRLHVYQFWIENERPPTFSETAQHFDLSPEEARSAYHRLNDAHALFLNPGTDDVLMAHPLSAVPTPYCVHIKDRVLWANCAWDSLGIPAMLKDDARIEARHAFSDEPVIYTVENGALHAPDGIVHFALPFSQWYDDLIHT